MTPGCLPLPNPFSEASPSAAPPSVLLTIAGHDPSSGAGITADLATFAAHRCFGLSAITALTVQSTRGVVSVQPVDTDILRHTLDTLAADFTLAGVKIGMLGSPEAVEAVADFLGRIRSAPGGQGTPIVLDPVLRSSSAAVLLPTEALDRLRQALLPRIDWITPNWPELAALTGRSAVASLPEAETAARDLARQHPHLTIVATGGDNPEPTDLLRLPSGQTHLLHGEHIASNATHGTGCAFSSALLAALVAGKSPVEAVTAAKHYVTEAIRSAPTLGHGKGPMHLLWPLERR
jgi:hydroxymethylpyrimidine/phosphomethylpyrimidine kinase